MSYLLIGIQEEELLIVSRTYGLDGNTPQAIADFMTQEMKGKPDQIIVVANGKYDGDGPEVDAHLFRGRDYN